MKHVTVEQARAQLETLLDAGETVEIVRDGKVVARLEPAARRETIDVSAIRAHQAKLTGPVMDTQSELDDWKNESRY